MLEDIIKIRNYARKVYGGLAFALFFSLSTPMCAHGIKPHTPIHIPTGYYEPAPNSRNPSSLSTSISLLERNLTGAYTTTEHSYTSGSVEIKREAIVLKSNGEITDKLYFSNIVRVRGVDLVSTDNGRVTSALGVWYKRENENDSDFYLLGVRDNIKDVTEAAFQLSIKQQKKNEDSSRYPPTLIVDGDNSQDKETETKSKTFSFSSTEQQSICQGEIPNGKTVEPMGKIEFGNCFYNPLESSSPEKLEEIVRNIMESNKGKRENGILLFCGNSSEPLANKCPQSKQIKDYGNLQLSFDRAEAVERYVYQKLEKYKKLEDSLKHTISIVYPDGTTLDERSVRVYLIKNASQKTQQQ